MQTGDFRKIGLYQIDFINQFDTASFKFQNSYVIIYILINFYDNYYYVLIKKHVIYKAISLVYF